MDGTQLTGLLFWGWQYKQHAAARKYRAGRFLPHDADNPPNGRYDYRLRIIDTAEVAFRVDHDSSIIAVLTFAFDVELKI